MNPHNMTGERLQFNNNFKAITTPIKKKESKFGFWDLVVTIIFLSSFFGCIYFYFANRTLKNELEQKHLLIMDLAKLLESRNAK
jgi:hypothetical protein